jgi:hypothetical protein
MEIGKSGKCEKQLLKQGGKCEICGGFGGGFCEISYLCYINSVNYGKTA